MNCCAGGGLCASIAVSQAVTNIGRNQIVLSASRRNCCLILSQHTEFRNRWLLPNCKNVVQINKLSGGYPVLFHWKYPQTRILPKFYIFLTLFRGI